MNKFKKAKICGFLTALVSVSSVAGAQGIANAIFFHSVREESPLGVAHARAKLEQSRASWECVATFAGSEAELWELTGNHVWAASSRTNAAFARAQAHPNNRILWEHTATLAERETVRWESIGDLVRAASSRANAAFVRTILYPNNAGLLDHLAILAESEAAGWETTGNNTNAIKARAYAAIARAHAAVARTRLDPSNLELLDIMVTLAEDETAAWESLGNQVYAARSRTKAAIARAHAAFVRTRLDPSNAKL